MKVCSNCNAVLNDEVRFCTKCGHPFEELQTPANHDDEYKTVLASDIPNNAVSGFDSEQSNADGQLYDDRMTVLADDAVNAAEQAPSEQSNADGQPYDNRMTVLADDAVNAAEQAPSEQSNADGQPYDVRMTVLADEIQSCTSQAEENTQGVAPEAPTMNSEQTKPSKKKVIIPIIIAAALVIVIGLGVGGFFIIKSLTRKPVEKIEDAIKKSNAKESKTQETLNKTTEYDGNKIKESVTDIFGDQYTITYEKIDNKVYISKYKNENTDKVQTYVMDRDTFDAQYNKEAPANLSDILYQSVDIITDNGLSKYLKRENMEDDFKEALDNSLGTEDMDRYSTVEEQENGVSVMSIDIGRLFDVISEKTGKDINDKASAVIKGIGGSFELEFTIENGYIKKVELAGKGLMKGFKKTVISCSSYGTTRVDIPDEVRDRYSNATEIDNISDIG